MRFAFLLPVFPALVAASALELQKSVTFHSFSDPEIPAPVLEESDWHLWTHQERGPLPDLKEYARENSGAVWLGGPMGAARFNPSTDNSWDRWQHFRGRRWLPDDLVRNIHIEETQFEMTVWIRTDTGISALHWTPMSLEAKSEIFEDRVERIHHRLGYVSSANLASFGKLQTAFARDDDNDGLWTAMYLAAESFRFAVTGDPQARHNAVRSFSALNRLEQATGMDGFPARTVVRPDDSLHDSGGEWHMSSSGQWMWKGDTSSDEIVGHYFGHSIFFDLAANDAERRLGAEVIQRITDHLIYNNFNLVDADGQPTRWGRWSEDYFATQEGKYERALRSLQLLSFLKTAFHMTNKKEYQEKLDELVQKGYANYIDEYRRWPNFQEINYSDDELAMLSWYPLLRYQPPGPLRDRLVTNLEFLANEVRPEKNPLWTYIVLGSGVQTKDAGLLADAEQTLRRIPLDLIDWPVDNAHRIDVHRQAEKDRFGKWQLREVLAPDERPLHQWNGNPYRESGGSGRELQAPTFYLLPYWMGRYYGWLSE